MSVMSDEYQRLDVFLHNRGDAPSRETAKKLINDSCVTVNGMTVVKASYLVTVNDVVTVAPNGHLRYVSRGAYKLEAALDSFKIDVNGLMAVDFGASTGGFTDVLLQRGAKQVFAIENGRGQLHDKLLNDPRVMSYDNTNARYIEKGFIPLCDIAVMDVSFISQTKLYNSVTNVLKDNGVFVSLIKPQFEAGKEYVGKKGIVKDPNVHKSVIEGISQEARLYGFKTVDIIPSPILGGDGNKEFLAYFVYSKTEILHEKSSIDPEFTKGSRS